MDTLNEEIRRKLFELADEKYKKFHSSLSPNVDNIIGVRVPLVKNLAKEIAKGNWQTYLNTAQNKYYEELLLQGLVLGFIKTDPQELVKYLEKFIPKINSWGICDSTVAGLKIVSKNKDFFWKIINKYLKSDKEFEIRFAVVMLLDFYIDEVHIDNIILELDKIKHDGYYVKMAVAWTLSLCYIRFPEKTLEYLKDCNLDNFTYNKTLQKVIESYRVSDSDKETLRNMKKK